MNIIIILFSILLFLFSLYKDDYISNKLLIFFIFLLIVFGTYLYIFHKPHRDFSSEPVAYSLSARDLLSDFQSDEIKSNKKYVNKVIQIDGVITSIPEENSPVINESVFCSFENSFEMKEGENIIIKGRCTGYDDMFDQVTLTKCMIIE